MQGAMSLSLMTRLDEEIDHSGVISHIL